MDDNELYTLEVIHRFVEILDRYFGNVCYVFHGILTDHVIGV